MLCFGSVFIADWYVVLWIGLFGSVFIADWYVVLWIGLRVMVHNGETIVQTLIQL